MIPIVSFVGWSNSGKTTFLTHVIQELKARGLSVAVVKNTCHPVEPDIQGKDTWHFANAGADIVVLNGPRGFVLQEAVTDRKEVSDVLAGISGVDIIILEGAGDAFLPKVEIWRRGCGSGHRFPPEALMALVADGLPEEGYKELPRFSHDDTHRFCDYLLVMLGI